MAFDGHSVSLNVIFETDPNLQFHADLEYEKSHFQLQPFLVSSFRNIEGQYARESEEAGSPGFFFFDWKTRKPE